jgi:hypothetical protein
VNHGTGLFIPRTDTFPFCPAAAGNEGLLPDAFKRTDVDKIKIVAVTFGIKLRCGQATGYFFATLHGIGIKRLFKPGSPARVHIGMYFGNVPDMVAELHAQVPEEPGGLVFAETGRETGSGRAHIIYMDLQEPRYVRVKDESLVLVMTG